MPEVAGSLWSVAPADQLREARRLRDAGLRRLHWDVSDGRFAAAGGFTVDQALALTESTGMRAEAHLMVVDPVREVDRWTEFCDLVVVHVESEGWVRAVDRIVARGCMPGVALSPGTAAEAAPADLTVLCMTVTPGAAGSEFDDAVLEKLPALRAQSPARRIGLDGGVQRRHAELAGGAGADWLVVGTDLFRRGGEREWSDLLHS